MCPGGGPRDREWFVKASWASARLAKLWCFYSPCPRPGRPHSLYHFHEALLKPYPVTRKKNPFNGESDLSVPVEDDPPARARAGLHARRLPERHRAGCRSSLARDIMNIPAGGFMLKDRSSVEAQGGTGVEAGCDVEDH